MSDTPTYVVKIRADGADVAGSAISRFSSTVDKNMRAAGGAAAYLSERLSAVGPAGAVASGALQALVAAVSVGSLIGGFRSAVDALDAFNDAADATGSTVETLSALEDVARRNGGTLDDVTGVLVKFNNVLKEADGKNGVSRALQAIGLDVRQLRALDPGEAVRAVAVRLTEFADGGDKARLVQELFGKSIRDAAPFLKDLAESGQLNAKVTAEQAAQAERFNKTLAGLQTTVGNYGRTLASDLLPVLDKVLKKQLAAQEVFGNGFKVYAETGLSGMVAMLGGDASKNLESATKAMSETKGALDNLRGQAARGGLNSAQAAALELTQEKYEAAQRLVKFYQQLEEIDKPDTGTGAAAGGGGATMPRVPNFSAPPATREKGDLTGFIAKELMAQQERDNKVLDAQADFYQRLSDMVEQSNIDLMADDEARGHAQIAFDRKVAEDRLTDLGIFGERRQAFLAKMDQLDLARERALTEQLKPEWQRRAEEWADTTKQMADAYNRSMTRLVDEGEAQWINLMKTGKLSISGITSILQEELARTTYRTLIRPEASKAADWLLGKVGISKPGGASGESFSGSDWEQQLRAMSDAAAKQTGQLTEQSALYTMLNERLGAFGSGLVSAGEKLLQFIVSMGSGSAGSGISEIFSKLFNIGSGGASGTGADGGGFSSNSWEADLASMGFGQFANGGISTGPMLAMVSEGRYRHEAHIPLPNGRSVPVELNGAGGGGMTLHQHITYNFAPGVSQADLRVLTERNNKQLRAETLAEASRPGRSLWKAARSA